MKISYKRLTFSLSARQLSLLKHRMRYVRAAGGIVCDSDGQMLIIKRNNRWDLPKGKVEANESLVQAAMREVEEETGIKVKDGIFFLKTYHLYQWGTLVKTANYPKGWHLKQTTWFLFTTDQSHPIGKPQTEEGITDIMWFPPHQWYRSLIHSYGTMKTIAKTWRQYTT